MKNKILTIVLTGGLVLTSMGWFLSSEDKVILLETVNKQKVDVDKKSTKIANLEAVIVQKDEKLEADVLVIEKLNDQILNKDKLIEAKHLRSLKAEKKLRAVERNLENEILKKKVVQQKQSEQVAVSRGNGGNRKTISMEATSYIAMCNTGCTGITKTGIDVRKTGSNQIIAVDPRVIPLHSKVKVTLQNGESFYARAEDTGGAIKGNRIDILKATYVEAEKFGRQTVTVTILE